MNFQTDRCGETLCAPDSRTDAHCRTAPAADARAIVNRNGHILMATVSWHGRPARGPGCELRRQGPRLVTAAFDFFVLFRVHSWIISWRDLRTIHEITRNDTKMPAPELADHSLARVKDDPRNHTRRHENILNLSHAQGCALFYVRSWVQSRQPSPARRPPRTFAGPRAKRS